MNETTPAILNIGVTGHRPNKLGPGETARLTGEVRRLIAGLRAIVDEASRPPRAAARLRIVSPLAEGADRIVARSGLEYGAELVALLPLAREDYMTDFATDRSRREFLDLLGRAREIVEPARMQQGGNDRTAAYARVGERVVEASDMLIALWDGKSAAGGGGTAEVIEWARRKGRPVLWLPTSVRPRPAGSAGRRLLVGDDTTGADAMEAFSAIAKRVVAAQL